jgi:hypothetical protein
VVVIVTGRFHSDVIADLEIGGFHLPHGREIFCPVLNLHEDDAVVPGVDYQIGIGDLLETTSQSFRGPVDLRLRGSLLSGISARSSLAAHAGKSPASELSESRGNGQSHGTKSRKKPA